MSSDDILLERKRSQRHIQNIFKFYLKNEIIMEQVKIGLELLFIRKCICQYVKRVECVKYYSVAAEEKVNYYL